MNPDQPQSVNSASFPLDRVARIEASLHLDPDRRDDILRANGLDDAAWTTLEDDTRASILEETKSGRWTRLEAFDTGYLARIMEARGEVTVDEYAHLVVADERGASAAARDALGIPEEAVLRIARSFQMRASEDADLAARLRAALRAERER